MWRTEVEFAVMICPKSTAVEGEEGSLTPKDFELNQNYPNPFNNQTVIKFNLRRPAEISLTIYNILGQKVRTLVEERLNAGSQTFSWDGKDDKGNDLSSGI
jgi:flagellar hook assembly protein FlgD